MKTLEFPGDITKLILATWGIEVRRVREFKGKKNGSKNMDTLFFYNITPSVLVCWVMVMN